MEFIASIADKPVYAGGTSSVNIRQSVTVGSASLGLITAGKSLGTATGNLFNDNDYPAVSYRWYEIRTADGKTGYVREDLVLLSKPTGSTATATATAPQTLKTVFDTQNTGFPVWAMVAMGVCFLLIVVAIIVLTKKRKK